MSAPEEEEFQEIQREASDEDPTIRGMAAIDLGSFAIEHSEYKGQCISILEHLLNDTDADVRRSAQKSLELIEGKTLIEPGKKVIGFGYVPEVYQEERPEIDKRQAILSCVCCIMMIIVIILFFTVFWP
ncbi:MAG: HEAT repeat domain-containing protein [Candidatus Helarchaeota archaeon]